MNNPVTCDLCQGHKGEKVYDRVDVFAERDGDQISGSFDPKKATHTGQWCLVLSAGGRVPIDITGYQGPLASFVATIKDWDAAVALEPA